MALLMGLIMVVLISAFVTDFNYSSRVGIITSTHYRDEVKATRLAQSGVRIYGMLLVLGRQVSKAPMVSGMLSSLGLNIDGASMVCKSIPFLDTAMLRYLTSIGNGMMSEQEEDGLLNLMGLPGGGEAKEGAVPVRGSTDKNGDRDRPTVRRSLLDFEGDFKVECSDETSRIDLNGFASAAWAGLTLQQHPTALMLYGQMAGEEFDPLFEERLKMDRWELIGNIRDWIDVDSQRGGLWGGDEDALYDDYIPRYRSKNSRLDTLAEVRLVHGVTDEVWALFSPAWSIHTKNFRVNVNTASPQMIQAILRGFTDPLIVTDQLLAEKIPELMIERIFLPYTKANDFLARAKSKGIVFNQNESRIKPLLTTDSRVFRLTSTGYVNESTRRIEMIMRVSSGHYRGLSWRNE